MIGDLVAGLLELLCEAWCASTFARRRRLGGAGWAVFFVVLLLAASIAALVLIGLAIF